MATNTSIGQSLIRIDVITSVGGKMYSSIIRQALRTDKADCTSLQMRLLRCSLNHESLVMRFRSSDWPVADALWCLQVVMHLVRCFGGCQMLFAEVIQNARFLKSARRSNLSPCPKFTFIGIL